VRRALGWLLAATLVLAGAACEYTAPDTVAAPFADCAGLTAPPRSAAPPSAAASPSAIAAALPAIEVECFTGSDAVSFDGLRGPAVVNLWASWCPPCVKELPALQRFADANAGRVHVVGVVTEDDPEAAASLADELGVRFPTLFDEYGEVRRTIAGPGLPVTLFVDRGGRLMYVYQDKALDEDVLADLAARHLGVGGR
jgi:thiol-disulfide isomerase/thioredoxin